MHRDHDDDETARVRAIVDALPPLTGDQLLRLAALLAP